MQPYRLCMLVEACGEVGHFERGLEVLIEALILADENDDRFYDQSNAKEALAWAY